jgi:hypothetical protein
VGRWLKGFFGLFFILHLLKIFISSVINCVSTEHLFCNRCYCLYILLYNTE